MNSWSTTSHRRSCRRPPTPIFARPTSMRSRASSNEPTKRRHGPHCICFEDGAGVRGYAQPPALYRIAKIKARRPGNDCNTRAQPSGATQHREPSRNGKATRSPTRVHGTQNSAQSSHEFWPGIRSGLPGPGLSQPMQHASHADMVQNKYTSVHDDMALMFPRSLASVMITFASHRQRAQHTVSL